MILTRTADDQRYEVPCSLLDELEEMKKGCETKQNNKDDGGDLGGVVPIKNIGVRVIKSRARVAIGHVDHGGGFWM